MVAGGLQCGYHGFVFDPSGTCVSVPGQDSIPSRANLVGFPVAACGPFVWVWPGDPVRAKVDQIPAMEPLESTGWTFVTGEAELGCDYGLLIDNLLDLSHETFIHAGTIGSPEIAETPITTEADEMNGVVRVRRAMRGVQCPAFFERFTGLRTPIDRGQDIEFFAPSMYLLHVTLAAGAPLDDPPFGNEAFRIRVFYAITPGGANITHFRFAMARDFGHDDDELSLLFERSQYDLIAEDARALEILQRGIDDQGWPTEVSIRIDSGGLASRRVLKQMAQGSTR